MAPRLKMFCAPLFSFTFVSFYRPFFSFNFIVSNVVNNDSKRYKVKGQQCNSHKMIERINIILQAYLCYTICFDVNMYMYLKKKGKTVLLLRLFVCLHAVRDGVYTVVCLCAAHR